jgi:hypothetical protein
MEPFVNVHMQAEHGTTGATDTVTFAVLRCWLAICYPLPGDQVPCFELVDWKQIVMRRVVLSLLR